MARSKKQREEQVVNVKMAKSPYKNKLLIMPAREKASKVFSV